MAPALRLTGTPAERSHYLGPGLSGGARHSGCEPESDCRSFSGRPEPGPHAHSETAVPGSAGSCDYGAW